MPRTILSSRSRSLTIRPSGRIHTSSCLRLALEDMLLSCLGSNPVSGPKHKRFDSAKDSCRHRLPNWIRPLGHKIRALGVAAQVVSYCLAERDWSNIASYNLLVG